MLEVLDEPELRQRTPSPSPSLRKKGTPSHALLWSPSPPKIPLCEFAVPRRPRRARPHWRRLAISPGLPRQSSGRGTTARCVAPPPSPAGAAVNCPHLDRRLRLEREIPLCVLNRGRRSENRQLSFNEILWTRGPAVVDPLYGPWTYSTDFSLQK
jgi:hypothetical protein